MTLTKHKSSGVYHARIRTADGKTKTITTRTADKTEARRIVKASGLRELEATAKAGRLTREAIGVITTGRKLTCLAAVAAWVEWMESVGKAPKTTHNNASTVRAFLHQAKLETVPPSAVNEKHISAWINSEDSESKAGTRAVNLAALRGFFGFCAAKGWTIGDPARLVRVNLSKLSHAQKEVAEREPFTMLEIKRLIKHCNDCGLVFWEFAVRLSNEIGLRLGDICNLEFDCFSKPGHIIVWTDKRDRRISVPISDEIEELVTMIPLTHPKLLFPEQAEINKDPARRASLSVQFKRLCERCEITDKTFHHLRHTCITRWTKEGKSLEAIGRDVAHKDTKTTRGYVHH